MIDLHKLPGQKIIELGGGDNPHPQCDVNVDVRPGPKTNFTADFNEPLQIQSDEWDGVYCQFVIEHLSWRKVSQFVAEIFRILKPGGMAVLITANTEAQMRFIAKNPNGWDGKNSFESNSCLLFGDQDYPENSHCNFMSPKLVHGLFQGAGFLDISTQPFGERGTDLLILAKKPVVANDSGEVERVVRSDFETLKQSVDRDFDQHERVGHADSDPEKRIGSHDSGEVELNLSNPEKFDREYFDGGTKVGGYTGEGYRDFPCHEITLRHLLLRQPASVLEIGCARGYILKRLEDRGIPCAGLEVSHHCYLTRACDCVEMCDLEYENWPQGDDEFAFSIATLEHIREDRLGHVLDCLSEYERGLHGIDFGHNDDGNDKTHVTLKSKEWWREKFDKHGLHRHEIVDKEELERGPFPEEVARGDGKVKLNVGSFTTMFHYGWDNIDLVDLGQWAATNGYRFRQHDVRNGLPYNTNSVDFIYSSHFLEHLTYEEGRKFLSECRRVIKPDGAMRLIVPDVNYILMLSDDRLDDLGQLNPKVTNSPTRLMKEWSLAFDGHQSAYNCTTLDSVLIECGFVPQRTRFRLGGFEPDRTEQIRKETIDMLPCLSLYMDAIPRVS